MNINVLKAEKLWMIVWLASYPRSGNTLLRTIFKHCFGIYSYADEPVNYKNEFRDNPELVGHIEYKGDWQQFYSYARESSELFLVKTHFPPVDNQPHIYIVRDGRAAICSYKRFQKNYNDIDVSLVELILGVDAYGGWSEHYYKWNNREIDKRLVVRFEDLVNISKKKLSELSEFIGFNKNVPPWQNPLSQLKRTEPNFFSTHESGFTPNEPWSPSLEYLFEMIHGELMFQLEYYNPPINISNTFSVPDHMNDLINDFKKIIYTLLQEILNLKGVCEERLALIQKLENICQERLELINLLNKKIL